MRDKLSHTCTGSRLSGVFLRFICLFIVAESLAEPKAARLAPSAGMTRICLVAWISFWWLWGCRFEFSYLCILPTEPSLTGAPHTIPFKTAPQVAWADLEFLILFPLPLKCWDYRRVPPQPAPTGTESEIINENNLHRHVPPTVFGTVILECSSLNMGDSQFACIACEYLTALPDRLIYKAWG